MLHTFLITVAIVGGIISPLLLLVLIAVLGNGLASLKNALELKIVETKMQPPFDEVESSAHFQSGGVAIRLVKNGEVVWQGNIPRKELEQ